MILSGLHKIVSDPEMVLLLNNIVIRMCNMGGNDFKGSPVINEMVMRCYAVSSLEIYKILRKRDMPRFYI